MSYDSPSIPSMMVFSFNRLLCTILISTHWIVVFGSVTKSGIPRSVSHASKAPHSRCDMDFNAKFHNLLVIDLVDLFKSSNF